MQRVFNEIGYLYQFFRVRILNAKTIALDKIDMTHLVKITIGLRYQRDPFVVMLPHKV